MSSIAWYVVGEWMRVRLLTATGGAVALTFFLVGCESSFLGPDQESGNEATGAGGIADGSGEHTEPEHNTSNDDMLLVVDDGSEVRDDCAHREIVVTADDAVVVLDGSCEQVRATGRRSTVDVGSADRIVLVGVDNRVSFIEGDPEVVNRGRNTTVTQGGTAKS